MSMPLPTVETPATTSKTFAKPMSALDARFEAQKLAFAPVVFQCVRIARKWGLLERIDASADGLTIADLARAADAPVVYGTGAPTLIAARGHGEAHLLAHDQPLLGSRPGP